MPGLPVVSGKEAVAAFEQLGWKYKRREPSHMMLSKPGVFGVLSIPDDREVKPGTLRSLLRVAGVTVEEFAQALHNS
jgi:predicted RNA binding protein YcfA (HicA-like mRNA interferase family)